MSKYHYFIIPRFNPKFNVSKLKNVEITNLSHRILRYSTSKMCILLIHTKSSMTVDQVKNSFGQIPTVKSSDYIAFNGKSLQTSELFLFTTIDYLKANVNLSNLLEIFLPEPQPFFAELNQSYVTIQCKDINIATDILNFCSHIPFNDGYFFISDKPFDLPLIEINDFPGVNEYIQKLANKEIFDHIRILNHIVDENQRHIVVLPSCEMANDLIHRINFTEYENGSIIQCNKFIGQHEERRLAYFEAKIEFENEFNLQLKKAFYLDMSNIGSVYRVRFHEKFGFVSFFDEASLVRLFQKYKASLSQSYSITFFNFSPKATIEMVKNYLFPLKLSPLLIVPAKFGDDFLPAFEIFFNLNEFDIKNKNQSIAQLNQFICSPLGVFNQHTRPFFVDTYFEDKWSVINQICQSNTIRIDIRTSLSHLYNQVIQFGIIKLLYINRNKNQISVTYDNYDQYQAALRMISLSFNTPVTYSDVFLPPHNQQPSLNQPNNANSRITIQKPVKTQIQFTNSANKTIGKSGLKIEFNTKSDKTSDNEKH